ncbi:MAG: TetR/AcrR family transcriptional regulator [Clostridia bacterium]|nr:TetR/AcrR family transcriptional regulator [Clostridia bacterium]
MDKRELILKEAEKLFAEKGYYGLGLSELLKRCEIPKGSFYYYFPGGKLQLIEETLNYSYQRMERGITQRILIEQTALKSFERMADHLTRRIGEKPLLASMFLSMIAIESVYLDENVNAACRRIYGQWQKLYADFLRRFGFGEEESVVKAQAVFALIHGSLISSWIKQDPADLQLAKRSLRDIIGDR